MEEKNKNKVKPTVLIVEDEESMRKILTDELEREGFTAIETKDGVEGLESALSNHPDIILIDILLPKLDGLEMLKKIREDKWGKDVPVLLLTNLGDMDKISEAVQIGITGYLVKSDWKLEDVVKKVRDALKKEKDGKT